MFPLIYRLSKHLLTYYEPQSANIQVLYDLWRQPDRSEHYQLKVINCGAAAASFGILSSSEWFWGCREVASKSGLSSFGIGLVTISVIRIPGLNI